ncbi:MAG: InlB B-repeat-containing protein, partial [Candidatus Ornithomonoglobus sp.]
MKKFIITLLALSTITASMIPVIADTPAEVNDAENVTIDEIEETETADDETADTEETEVPEKTEEPEVTAIPKPYDETIDTRMDLSGKVTITGESPLVYNIGAPLLSASIKPDGNSYSLTLSTFEGLEIYYTKDGSTPLPSALNTSKYTEPVKLSSAEAQEDGTVNPAELRVIVVDPDGSMDGAVASSYFSDIDEEAIATPEPEKFTASFWSDGGSEVEPQTVYVGEKLAEPASIIKSGFTFDGWFKDELFADKWNFSTDVLNDNVILYAKWLSANIEILSNYHVIDQADKTITPDKNSSTGEFIRKIRF